jgi:hypothetical protein
MTERERMIVNYIDGYNRFDINKMVEDFADNIEFENISNGQTNLLLIGLNSFKEQAEQAKNYFSSRTQTIKSYKHQDDQTEIEIDYYAILAIDFPNGLKIGDELKLSGKSVFKFEKNRITKLTDIS